ncbi:MAG: hypothetical protein P4M02_01315 [Clostridia bacterium]|nr:hypothetical protein [Clostridia bacterium]
MGKCFRKNGYALLWVICIFAFAALLSIGMLTATTVANKTAIQQVNTQQAYFTARSAAQATVAYIQKNANNATVINNLLASPEGSGSESAMGSYRVTVAQVSSDQLTITATATYNQQTSTVAAHLVRSAATVAPSVVPADKMFYLGSGGGSTISAGLINGPVYAIGDVSLSQSTVLNGVLYASGNVTISGSGATTQGVVCNGDLDLEGSGCVNGNVCAKGSVIVNSNVTISGIRTAITGTVQCDGFLKLTNGPIGNPNVVNDPAKTYVMVGGGAKTSGATVYCSGGSPKIYGNYALLYQGSISCSGDPLSSQIPGTKTLILSYTPVDLSTYQAPVLPTITVPVVSTVKPAITYNTINTSGTISSDATNPFQGLNWGTTVLINTAQNDVTLVVDNYNLQLGNGLSLRVSGKGRLFIYLKGNSSLSYSGSNSQTIGMQNGTDASTIFIIGDGTAAQNVTVTNCELDACVYIPTGRFSASGNENSGSAYIFQGSCVAKTINLDNHSLRFNYIAPDLSNTPLSVLSSGSQGSGSAISWSVTSWGSR